VQALLSLVPARSGFLLSGERIYDRIAEANGSVIVIKHDAVLITEWAPEEQVPAVEVDHI
jgi:hypothetical protein